MGIEDNDMADGKAKRYVGNPPTISATEEVHTLAYARRTARKTQDHKWVNAWKKGGKSQALNIYVTAPTLFRKLYHIKHHKA